MFHFIIPRVVLVLLASLSLIAPAPATAAAIDATELAKLEHQLRAGELPNIHSVVIVEDRKTLAEWYFQGSDERRGNALGNVMFAPDTLHDLRSVTKSIVSILFGIALNEGAVKNIDERVLSYFPEYADLRNADRLKIRLRDVLSMTSGLRWDESTFPYTDSRNSETAMDFAPDRYRYILSQPVEVQPGQRFRYSGGDVALIGAVVARATKTPLEVYAQRKLFAPLGISRFEWLKDSSGIPYAASGLRLVPRDMAKIGQLVLDGGRYEGRQIVPKAWLEASTSTQVLIEPNQPCSTKYGYSWWLMTTCEARSQTPWFGAIGNGGQRIMVFPSLDLVLVTTAGLYNSRAGDQTADKITLAVLAAAGKPVLAIRP